MVEIGLSTRRGLFKLPKREGRILFRYPGQKMTKRKIQDSLDKEFGKLPDRIARRFSAL